MTMEDSSVGSARRLHTVVALVSVAAIALILTGDHRGLMQSSQEFTVAHAREVNDFKDLQGLIDGSDVIIRGTIESTRPGRVIGDDEASRLRLRELVVSVSETLKGTTGPSIIVEELAWGQGGPLMLNGQAWGQAGEDAIYFLTSSAQGNYTAVSSRGRYVIDSDETLASVVVEAARDGDELIRDVEGRTYPDVKEIAMGGARGRHASSD